MNIFYKCLTLAQPQYFTMGVHETPLTNILPLPPHKKNKVVYFFENVLSNYIVNDLVLPKHSPYHHYKCHDQDIAAVGTMLNVSSMTCCCSDSIPTPPQDSKQPQFHLS